MKYYWRCSKKLETPGTRAGGFVLLTAWREDWARLGSRWRGDVWSGPGDKEVGGLGDANIVVAAPTHFWLLLGSNNVACVYLMGGGNMCPHPYGDGYRGRPSWARGLRCASLTLSPTPPQPFRTSSVSGRLRKKLEEILFNFK